jgi:hypothetical protein
MKDEEIKYIIEEIKKSNKDSYKVEIDSKYFDKNQKRWNTHDALGTTNHEHYSHYKDDIDIEIMMVIIEDSKEEVELYYIEETFDEMNNDFAFDKYNKNKNYVFVFSDIKKCKDKICELLSNKCDKSKEYFLEYFEC